MFDTFGKKKYWSKIKSYYLQISITALKATKWAADKNAFVEYAKYFENEAKKL